MEVGSTSRSTNTNRRRTSRACVYCQRSHMTCDEERPCKRCLKRRIGHLCCDSSLPTNPSAAMPPGVVEGTGDVATEAKMGPSPSLSDNNATPKREDAAQILFSLHDQVDSILGQYLSDQDSAAKHVDERRSNQFLIQFVDDHYSMEGKTRLYSVINQLKLGIEQLCRVHGRAPWWEMAHSISHLTLEFDKLLATTTTPHLLVRMSGEILRASSSFASMVRLAPEELTNHWHFYELLTEEAHVNLVEKIADFLLMRTHCGSLLTACTIVPEGLRSLAVRSSTAVGGTEGRRARSDHSSRSSSPLSPIHSLGPSTPIKCSLSARIPRDRHFYPLLIIISLIPLSCPDKSYGMRRGMD